MKIVLYNPEIPLNTGNIARTCYATKTDLILIPPLGFSISSRKVKRSGLDYWNKVNIKIEKNIENILSESTCFYFFSKKAKKIYSDVSYSPNSILIFGSETMGLPKEFFFKWEEHFVKLPMYGNTRCLNLSNSVAVALYEAFRQNSFTFS